MNILALALLLIGLILGVFSMLFGAERRMHLTSVGAFAFAFGLTAYLLTRYSNWSIAAQLVTAGVVGSAAMSLQTLLVARWAIPNARAEQIDERFVLQGTIAHTTRHIPETGDGEISYRLDNSTYQLPARTIDASAVAVGTEVVIDRIESGIAFVESWARVEARL